jgi:hypothetical protein
MRFCVTCPFQFYSKSPFQAHGIPFRQKAILFGLNESARAFVFINFNCSGKEDESYTPRQELSHGTRVR